MPRYRRAKLSGGTFFFTVAIANRRDDLLVREIERLRRAYHLIQQRRPFETIAICILPDHLHAIWSLPENDWDSVALESDQGRLYAWACCYAIAFGTAC